jgi:hypothetical protein
MEPGAVSAHAALVPERFCVSLPERDTAILDGVVGVHVQVALAAELQIHDRVLCEQR